MNKMEFKENIRILHLEMSIGNLSFDGGLPVAKQDDYLMILFPKIRVPEHGQDAENIRNEVYKLAMETLWNEVISNYAEYPTIRMFAKDLWATQIANYRVFFVDEVDFQ